MKVKGSGTLGCFNIEHGDMFDYIIHHLLKVEIFDSEDPSDKIEEIVPDYLKREKFLLCKQTFEELYNWTADTKFHEMEASHECLLYHFLEYMEWLQDEVYVDNFNDLYFDKKSFKLMKKAIKYDFDYKHDDYGRGLIYQKDLADIDDTDLYDRDEEEISEQFFPDYYEKNKYYYCDISNYFDYILEDTDFLLIADLYNERNKGNFNIEEWNGINIDYYFNLLPNDIQKKFPTKHITLSSEVISIINFINDKLNYGSLVKLLWNNSDPVSYEKIQIIIDNILTSYYANQNVEILWKSFVEEECLSFVFWKRFDEKKNILFEIRKPDKTYLTSKYVDVLLKKYENYKNAFYSFICFTDEEYNIINDFIHKYIYTDQYTMYLNVTVLDARKKVSASIPN